MNDLDPWLTQASVWTCVRRLARGQPCPSPLSIELHLGTACNLACPECISRPILDTGRFEPRRAISLAQEIVDLGTRSVVLSGGGEPLLHPSVDEVLRTLSEGGVASALVTNGTLLSRHFDAVVKYPQRVWISVDAATARLYSLFRPSRHGAPSVPFDKMIDDIGRLASARRGNVAFSFLLLGRDTERGIVTNATELAQAARIARDLGCKTFEVNVGIGRDMLPISSLRSVSSIVSEQLASLRTLVRQDFHIHVSPWVESVARGESLELLGKRRGERCRAAEVRALVSPRGVYLCAQQLDEEFARYGDPTQNTLREIWQSPVRQDAMDRTMQHSACDSCLSMGLQERLSQGISYVREGAMKPIIHPDEDWFL